MQPQQTEPKEREAEFQNFRLEFHEWSSRFNQWNIKSHVTQSKYDDRFIRNTKNTPLKTKYDNDIQKLNTYEIFLKR